MHFTLSAVGSEQDGLQELALTGALADAVREAEAILERDPACETVEIFAEGCFLRDIARRLN